LTTIPHAPLTGASPAPTGAPTRRTWPLRACLGLNVLGAGVPGAVLLVAPQLATDVAGAPADPAVARLVGAIWFSIGVVSVAVLRRPQHGRGLLGVQVLYKSVYVATVGLPALVAGTASPTTTGLTAGFAAVVVAWATALLSTRGDR
jgi:hypothetical protein